MELRALGNAEGPAVLLLPAKETDRAALLKGLAPLEKQWRLLLPGPYADAAALENILLRQGLDELGGAWGLRDGATLLL